MQNIEQQSSPLAFTAYGGGHGLAMVLSAASESLPEHIDVRGVVSTFDRGGSSRRLSDMFGIQAVGDLGRGILASSRNCEAATTLFEQRFNPEDNLDTVRELGEKMIVGFGHVETGWAAAVTESALNLAQHSIRTEGTLADHTYRNFVLAALAVDSDDLTKASRHAERLWNARAQLYPVTHDLAELVLRDGGITKIGEDKIDVYDTRDPKNALLSLDREVATPDDVRDVIVNTHTLVSAPGSLGTSVLAVVAPTGVKSALRDTHAKHHVILPSPVHHAGSGKITARDWVDIVQRHTGARYSRIILDSAIPAEAKPIARPTDITELRASHPAVDDERLTTPTNKGVQYDTERVGQAFLNLLT